MDALPNHHPNNHHNHHPKVEQEQEAEAYPHNSVYTLNRWRHSYARWVGEIADEKTVPKVSNGEVIVRGQI